jgi:hypothetical protein
MSRDWLPVLEVRSANKLGSIIHSVTASQGCVNPGDGDPSDTASRNLG